MMNRALIAAANFTAATLPRTFKANAGREFMRPRVRQQTDRGRDWLATLDAAEFEGPEGIQRVYRGGSGPLVMFQHGWEADSADLSSIGQAVMQAGFSVALIDGPAHGQSAGRKANIILFAQGLGLAAEQLGQPYAMVCHSMGLPASVIAMSRYQLAPQRVVGLGAPDAFPRNVAYQSQRMGLSKRALNLTLEAAGDAFGEPVSNLDILLYAPDFSIPALILHGEADTIAPVDGARRIAESWPAAELQTFEGLGHRGIARDPRVMDRVTTFLNT